MEWIDSVLREFAELPDRNSPEGWPEAMLVTGAELRQIIITHAPAEPVNARLLDALKLAECVYRKNVVNEGEPSSVLEAMQAAITAAEAQRPTDYSSMVDRAWARFCGAFGDGPDAPYPGMIASFEIHYGQSFRDKEWRTEASCWAAAWHKATELATKTNPQAKEIEMTDEQKQMAYYKAGMLKKAPPFVPARVRVLKEQFGDGPFRGAGVPAGEHDCRCNKWGAVSVSARDGKLLGLRLDEFEPVAWRENAPPAETCNPQAKGDSK